MDLKAVAEYVPKGASNCFRQLCLDFNWQTQFFKARMDEYFTQSSPVEIAEFAKAVNLDAVLLLAVPHQGFTTYDSEFGDKFPTLGKMDWFGECIEELHKRDIAALGYVTIGCNQKYADEHPEYANPGEGFWESTFGGPICSNSPYIDLVTAYSEEVLRRFPVDALRWDILSQPKKCRCEYCKKAYREQFGEEIPAVFDESNFPQWHEFAKATISRVVLRLHHACRAVKPNVETWQNHLAFGLGDSPADMDVARVQDMSYCEGGSPFLQLILTGVLNLKGTIVGHLIRTPERRLSVALGARSYAPFAVDHKTILPEEHEKPWFYNDLGPFYSMVKEIEPYLVDTKPVPYLGLVYCEQTRYRYPQYDRAPYINLLSDLAYAWLGRSQVPQFISNLDLPSNDYSSFKLLALPETCNLLPEQLEALKGYVEKGGQLLIIGDAMRYDANGKPLSDFSLARVMGVSFIKRHDNPGSIELRGTGVIETGHFPVVIKAKAFNEVNVKQGETLIMGEIDGDKMPVLHVNSYEKGRIAYLATSDNISLIQAAAYSLIGHLQMKTSENKQAVVTRQEKEGRWILHLIDDGDMTVQLDSRYCSASQVVGQYPSGWSYQAEMTPLGLKIKAGDESKDRLLVLK